MSLSTVSLFNQLDLSAVLRAQEEKMKEEIDSYNGEKFLNTNPSNLCEYFEEKYRVDSPLLLEDQISVQVGETKIDVSQDFRRGIVNQSKPYFITGSSYKFFVPFEGDWQLFRCQPSSFGPTPPRAALFEDRLEFIYIGTELTPEQLKFKFTNDFDEVKTYLKKMADEVAVFNSILSRKVSDRVETRRKKLLNDRGVLAALGFPLRERPDAPGTYTVPTVRKKIQVSPPPVTSTPFVPEPTLSDSDYEHILGIMKSMVTVMEQSPKAFSNMGEEDIRQHFLVQLNGHYQGGATGETFNYEGKTDILIRESGRNIFVAECKFWKGPFTLTSAIDQLLGYLTWRDTKTALVIFNRRKNLSSVLKQIPEAVKEHPNFKRELCKVSETEFRYKLTSRLDQNREIFLAILAFDVPD